MDRSLPSTLRADTTRSYPSPYPQADPFPHSSKKTSEESFVLGGVTGSRHTLLPYYPARAQESLFFTGGQSSPLSVHPHFPHKPTRGFRHFPELGRPILSIVPVPFLKDHPKGRLSLVLCPPSSYIGRDSPPCRLRAFLIFGQKSFLKWRPVIRLSPNGTLLFGPGIRSLDFSGARPSEITFHRRRIDEES